MTGGDTGTTGVAAGPAVGASWTFRLPVPPPGDWFALDLNPRTRAGSTRELFERAAAADDRVSADPEEFAAVIDRLARDAARRGALVAYSRWWPGTGRAPHSMLCVVTANDNGASQLADRLAAARETDLSPHAVEPVQLPAGPALRLRVYATGGPTEDHGAVVVDTVQYWLPLTGTGRILIIAAATSRIDDGDDLASLIDALADGLVVDPPADQRDDRPGNQAPSAPTE